MQLDILFRTCSRVNTFTGLPRFLPVPKREIIYRCLNSVLISCLNAKEFSVTLKVMDDHSDTGTVNKIKELLKKYPQIKTDFISLTETGNGKSLNANYHFARAHCKDLVYFCEDDYLHAPNAINEMLKTYLIGKSKVVDGKMVIHPCDYPDRYIQLYPSYIFPGSDRHWRSIKHTTGTILMPVSVLLEYWDNYMKLTEYGINREVSEENTINLVYNDILCISPLPSLAVHLQFKETLSYFIDWQKWWDDSKVSDG